MVGMQVRGRVKGNTVLLEEALPEGAEVDVVVRETGFRLDEASQRELLAARDSVRQGRGVEAEEVLRRLEAAGD